MPHAAAGRNAQTGLAGTGRSVRRARSSCTVVGKDSRPSGADAWLPAAPVGSPAPCLGTAVRDPHDGDGPTTMRPSTLFDLEPQAWGHGGDPSSGGPFARTWPAGTSRPQPRDWPLTPRRRNQLICMRTPILIAPTSSARIQRSGVGTTSARVAPRADACLLRFAVGRCARAHRVWLTGRAAPGPWLGTGLGGFCYTGSCGLGGAVSHGGDRGDLRALP